MGNSTKGNLYTYVVRIIKNANFLYGLFQALFWVNFGLYGYNLDYMAIIWTILTNMANMSKEDNFCFKTLV